MSKVVVQAQSRNYVKVFAPAKINLLLRVGEIEPNQGRHRLLTVFRSLDLGETIELAPSLTTSTKFVDLGKDEVVTVSGNEIDLPSQLDSQENLVLTALKYLRANTGVEFSPTRVRVCKRIPVAGGMAGGSADAAGTLLGASVLYNLGLSLDRLQEVGSQLGSDIPFGFVGGTAVGTRFGDSLSSLPCDTKNTNNHFVSSGIKCWWVLAVAKEGLSTPRVFHEYDRLHPQIKSIPDYLDRATGSKFTDSPYQLAQVLHNDLEEAAISLRPELEQVIRTAESSGALRAIVSGSGPTVACLCADPQTAVRISSALMRLPQLRSTIVTTG